jgi:hypothetical protein
LETYEDHRRIREFLLRHKMVSIASSMDRLRQWRNMSDYDDEVSNIAQLLSFSILGAHQVFIELG